MIGHNKLPNQLKQHINQFGLIGEESHLKMTPYRRLAPAIPDNHRKGAVLLLLYFKDNSWHFPLIQRQPYDGVHSKQMSFPGGKIEAFDQTAYHAALREANEEVGVRISSIDLIEKLSPLYIPPSNFLVHPFLSFYDGMPSFMKDEIEVDEIVEVPVSELLNPANERQTLVNVQGGMKLKTPYYHLQEKVVWGATAAILAEFKDILKKLS